MTEQEIQQILNKINQINGNWATEATLKSIANKLRASDKSSKQIIDKLGTAIPELGNKAEKVKINIAENLKWATEKLGKTFDGLSKINTNNIASNLAGLGGSLKSVGKNIEQTSPLLSKFASGLGTTATVITFLVDKFQESTAMLSNLYGTGIVAENGILGLSTAASNAGITAQKFAELLTKYSNVAIGTGYSRTIKLSKMFADATNLGSKFILTNEESQEAILETMSLLQLSGRLRSMNDAQVVNAAEDYISEINKLSEATGRNRKEIMASTKEALKLPYAFTILNSLPPEMKKRFQSIATNLAGMFGDRGKDLTEDMAKYLVGGVALLGPEMKLLMTGMGGEFGAAFKNLANVVNQGGDDFEASLKFTKALKSIDTEMLARTNPELLAYVTNLKQATQAMEDENNRLMAMSETDRQEALKKRRQDREDLRKQQEVINKGRAALASMTNSIFQVIGALSPGLTTVFQALADATQYILKHMMSFGKNLRDWIKGSWFNNPDVDDKDNTRRANMVAVVTAVVGGTVGLFLIKSVLGLLIGGAAGMLTKGIGKLIGGVLPSLGGAALSKLAGGSALGKLAGGGPLKGLSTIVGGFGTAQFLKGAAGLTLLAGSVYVISKAFREFNAVNWSSLAKAGVAIGAITAAVSLIPAARVITGGLALGAAIGAIGGAMMLAGEGLSKFQNIDWETLAKAGVAIAAITAVSALAGAGPQALAIGLGGVAIGAAIAAIGAGIAGAAWLTGETLPKLSAGLTTLTNIDYGALSLVGSSMIDLSTGLLALGGSQLVDSISGFATSIFNMFREDPISKLKRFAEIGQPLKIAADALKMFSDTLPTAISGLSSLNNADKAVEVMNKLKDAFSTGWFSSRITDADLEKGIFLILRKFANNRELIANAVEAFQQLGTLSSIAGNITLTSDGVNRIRSVMSGLTIAGPANTSLPSANTGPVITMNELNLKTVKYYEDSINKFTELNDKIERTNALLEVLRTSNTDNSYRIVNAVESNGQRVR